MRNNNDVYEINEEELIIMKASDALLIKALEKRGFTILPPPKEEYSYI